MAARSVEGHLLDELICLQLDCFRRAIKKTDAEEVEFLETLVTRLDLLYNLVHTHPPGRAGMKRRQQVVKSLTH